MSSIAQQRANWATAESCSECVCWRRSSFHVVLFTAPLLLKRIWYSNLLPDDYHADDTAVWWRDDITFEVLFFRKQPDSYHGASACPESAEAFICWHISCCAGGFMWFPVTFFPVDCLVAPHGHDFNVSVTHTRRHYCSSCLRTTMELGCCVTFVPALCITCLRYYVTCHISIAALATLWPPRYWVCLLFLESAGGPCSAPTKPARIWFHVGSNSGGDTRMCHIHMHAQLLYWLLLAILLLFIFFKERHSLPWLSTVVFLGFPLHDC